MPILTLFVTGSNMVDSIYSYPWKMLNVFSVRITTSFYISFSLSASHLYVFIVWWQLTHTSGWDRQASGRTVGSKFSLSIYVVSSSSGVLSEHLGAQYVTHVCVSPQLNQRPTSDFTLFQLLNIQLFNSLMPQLWIHVSGLSFKVIFDTNGNSRRPHSNMIWLAVTELTAKLYD